MTPTRTRLTVLAIILLLQLAEGSLAAQKRLADWTFERTGDLQGWQPNGHLADLAVTNGALSCRAVGSDPILEHRPLLDLPASPWQAVEIRLRLVLVQRIEAA